MTVPGHTQGHSPSTSPTTRAIFTGDTLFAMGCGRLFEGTPADMFANMQRYAALPDDTPSIADTNIRQSNGRFALVAEPDNDAIADADGRGRCGARTGRADGADDDRGGARDQPVPARDIGRTIRELPRRQG